MILSELDISSMILSESDISSMILSESDISSMILSEVVLVLLSGFSSGEASSIRDSVSRITTNISNEKNELS